MISLASIKPITYFRNVDKYMEHKLHFVVAAMQEVPWQEMIERWQYLESTGWMVSCWLTISLILPTQIPTGMRAGPCFLL